MHADSPTPKPSKTPQLTGMNRHARRRMAALTRAQARKDAAHDKAFVAAVNKAQEVISSEELAADISREISKAKAEGIVCHDECAGGDCIYRPDPDACPDCSGYDGCHDVFCPRG